MEGIRDMALGSMVTAEDNYNSACDSKKYILNIYASLLVY